MLIFTASVLVLSQLTRIVEQNSHLTNVLGLTHPAPQISFFSLALLVRKLLRDGAGRVESTRSE